MYSIRPRVGFDKNSLERLEQLFRKTVGNEKEIQREDFKKIITSKNVSFLFPLIENRAKPLNSFVAIFHRASLPNIR